jgi:hypothetical protein
MKHLYLSIFFVCMASFLAAQVPADSVLKDHTKQLDEHSKLFRDLKDSIRKIRIEIDHSNEDLTLTGTRIISRTERISEDPRITFGGYASVYYAWYSDSADKNNFQKFPTAAPQSGAFGLNLAQITSRYSSRSVRANVTLQFGDMPRSVWSPVYNYIQEANAGVRILKKLWLDAGLFRTHLGLESIQPRENIATSVGLPTYFEPYYLGGAKLTYQVSQRFTVQANMFNSFNGFTENNHKKALGLSFIYELDTRFSLTFNSLWNDDSPDSARQNKGRLYNNLYMIFRYGRLTLGFEGNYGIQQNTTISPEQHTAQVVSGLLEGKVRVWNQLSCYGRLEYFNDPDEILTGPEYNSNRELVGLNVNGATLGLEIKPRPNSYLRLEGRILRTADSHEKIFVINDSPSRIREEIICSFGVWF